MIRQLVYGISAVAVAACAPTSYVLVGTARPPIPVTDVKVYLQPPPAFEDIATLNASADSAFGTGGQASVDRVLQRLKEQAAKLGANGIVLEGISDRQTASIGGGTGSTSYSGNSAVGVGVGGSLGIFKKTGHARAILVPAGSAPPPGVPPPPGAVPSPGAPAAGAPPPNAPPPDVPPPAPPH